MNENFLAIVAVVLVLIVSIFSLKKNMKIENPTESLRPINLSNIIPDISHKGSTNTSVKNTAQTPNTKTTPNTNSVQEIISTKPTDFTEYVKIYKTYKQSASNADPLKEYVTLKLNSNAPGPITLTGMKLRSDYTNVEVTIPDGVSLYTPGVAHIGETIKLEPGGVAYIVTGKSPVGYSIKLNSCSGYLENDKNFNPYISSNCPLAYKEGLFPNTPYYAACLDKVESLGRCSPTPKNIPLNFPNECVEFLTTKLNYKTCVSDFSNTENFKKNEWRIYLGRSEVLWNYTREKIALIDQQGKTIAETY